MHSTAASVAKDLKVYKVMHANVIISALSCTGPGPPRRPTLRCRASRSRRMSRGGLVASGLLDTSPKTRAALRAVLGHTGAATARRAELSSGHNQISRRHRRGSQRIRPDPADPERTRRPGQRSPARRAILCGESSHLDHSQCTSRFPHWRQTHERFNHERFHWRVDGAHKHGGHEITEVDDAIVGWLVHLLVDERPPERRHQPMSCVDEPTRNTSMHFEMTNSTTQVGT